MIVKIDRSFEKDTNHIKDKKLLDKVTDCIDSIIKASDINEIKNIKKMLGEDNHFRIRIGNYRIGIVIHRDTVVFERFLHRKDIYKYFP